MHAFECATADRPVSHAEHGGSSAWFVEFGMAIKSSVCVALACAGLGPVAAGLVFHTKSVSHAAAIETHAAPWGALSVPVEAAVLDVGASEVLRKHFRLAPRDATIVAASTRPADATPAPEQVEAAVDTPVVRTSIPGPAGAPEATPAEPQPAADQPASSGSPTREARVAPFASTAIAPSTDQSASVAEVSRDEASDHPDGPGAALDLNTASMTALNHIPGMSNIGRAIVNHRPYRSIDDLVSRHVLRISDFRRVRDKVKV